MGGTMCMHIYIKIYVHMLCAYIYISLYALCFSQLFHPSAAIRKSKNS